MVYITFTALAYLLTEWFSKCLLCEVIAGSSAHTAHIHKRSRELFRFVIVSIHRVTRNESSNLCPCPYLIQHSLLAFWSHFWTTWGYSIVSKFKSDFECQRCDANINSYRKRAIAIVFRPHICWCDANGAGPPCKLAANRWNHKSIRSKTCPLEQFQTHFLLIYMNYELWWHI